MEDNLPFNMSLATLERIDQILKDVSSYAVNNNIIGYKSNLLELYKETFPFLSKSEKTTGQKKWDAIASIDISLGKQTLTFDDSLFDLLVTFDFWLRSKLHKHNITYAKSRDLTSGLGGLSKKYGLKN